MLLFFVFAFFVVIIIKLTIICLWHKACCLQAFQSFVAKQVLVNKNH